MAEVAATDKKSNGQREKGYPNEDAWTTWPGVARAAKILGVSLKQMRDMVTFGEIQCHHAKDGTVRFHPGWLDEYIADREETPEDEPDGKSDKAASRAGIPADAIRATAELLRSSQSQNLDLHRLVLQGFKAASEAQDTTIQRLLERQGQYEAIITDLLKAREMYFDAQLEREVMRNQHAAAQRRRDELFEVSKGWAGELVEGLKKKYGLDAESGGKISATIELLKALTPEQIEVGATMGFFEDGQIDLIETIIGRKIPRPKPQGSPPSDNSGSKSDESVGAAEAESSSAAPTPDNQTPPAQAGEAAQAEPNQ
jgi:hypothetical protein